MSWSWAPAQPAPARIVTAPALFSTCAAAASDSSSGRTTGEVARIGYGLGPVGASARNTSPGTTTTATPPRASAARMAVSSTPGELPGDADQLAVHAALAE